MSSSWLSSPEGKALILAAREFSDSLTAIPALRKRFSELSPDLISLAFGQAQLQHRLESRWGTSAADLLLTEDGISQATRPAVAKYRAEFIANKFGANAHVLDLTCGLGFDAREFARHGLRVTAVEIDPVISEYARHNLLEFGIEVHCADATEFDIPDDVDVIHRVCLPCPLGPGTPTPSHLWQLPAENPGALSASSQPYWGVNSISIRS